MNNPSSAQQAGALAVLGASAAVFWRTAYPTITWWDSSGYSLAAATLGVESAPGSLLLTVLGWAMSRLSFGASTAHVLNLVAGVVAALTAMLVYLVALRLLRAGRPIAPAVDEARALAIGTALGALTFAFTDTLWDYATQFTPYGLSALFTGLILLAMVRWWEDADRPNALWRIAVLGLLFGLDFSVHRTNALLLPGALAWILIRSPRTLRQPRALAGGACGLLVGLAVQLLIIPIAAFGRSPLNFNDPSNWSRFRDYITLKQLGGSFLLQVLPRKANVWSIQIADVGRVIGANFLHWTASTGVLGMLPGVVALLGLLALWRANRRLAIAWVLVLLLQATATVLYFNIPAGYFRSFDRHYLPICVTMGVLVAYGLGAATQWIASMVRPARQRITVVGVAVAVCVVPVGELAGNWRERDASNRFFARDWAINALSWLPPNAIYFTVGDNDTFPVMYVQAVEGVRRDVTIINLSVAGSPGYAERIHRRDPSYPLSANVAPVDLARANGPRPVTYAMTIASSGQAWPQGYARLEGLYWRITPERDPLPDLSVVRANILEKSQYRGFADPGVRIDQASREMAFEYYAAGTALLTADLARGEIDQCRVDRKRLFAVLPPERLAMPADYRAGLESACGTLRRGSNVPTRSPA